MLRCLVLCCCLLLSTTVWSQAPASAEPERQESVAEGGSATPAPGPVATMPALTRPALNSAPGSGVKHTSPITVVLALGAIIGLIFASAWLMKRMGAVNLGSAGGMKILAGLSVGPREKVLLIEVGEQQLLIGVAAGRVSHLQTFAEPVVTPGQASSSDFSQRLRSLVGAAANDRAVS